MIIAAAFAVKQLADSYFASELIKDNAEINRDVAEMNAEFAELDAYDAMIAGESKKAEYQSVIDKTLSEQQAIMAAQGIDTSFGTASEIQAETRFIGEINKMEIEKEAEERALGYTREAKGIRLNSFLNYSASMSKASSTMTQGATSAGRTLLSGYGR